MSKPSALFLLVPCLAACAWIGAAERSVIVTDGRDRYEIPPPAFGGKTLSVTRQETDAIAYSAPFGSRRSLCTLTVGGERLLRDKRRKVRNYQEFCVIKATNAISPSDEPGEVGSQPWQRIAKIREDKTSLIVSTRWKEDNTNLYGATAIVLANDLPLTLTILMYDRSDPERERDIEKGMIAWADRTVAVNKRIPQRITVERGFQNIDVPFPPGLDRYLANDPDDNGWFCSFDAPRRFIPDKDYSYAAFPRLRETEDKTTSLYSFNRFKKDILEQSGADLPEFELVSEGERHFLTRCRQSGKPESYVDFLFVKSRLLTLSYTPAPRDRRDPIQLLNEWRRATFRENLERAE